MGLYRVTIMENKMETTTYSILGLYRDWGLGIMV